MATRRLLSFEERGCLSTRATALLEQMRLKEAPSDVYDRAERALGLALVSRSFDGPDREFVEDLFARYEIT